jgi:hypothetical protein
MKRILSTLSLLSLALVMSAFASSQTPAAACCQGKAACCDQTQCCDHGKCCKEGAACCPKTPKPACCDGADSGAKPADTTKP